MENAPDCNAHDYFKCLNPILSSVYPATNIKLEPIILKRNALNTAKKKHTSSVSCHSLQELKHFIHPSN